jgi:two-component system response regulator
MSQKLTAPIVLLVEDNADDEALALRGLRIHLPSARVSVARDGREAIGCLDGRLTIHGEEIKAIPDFVLLDLKLPLASGFEVLKAIRATHATQNVPVVVFSSSNEPRDVSESYALGANTYVQKPTSFDDYLPTLRDVAHYWFEVAQLPA